MSTAMMVKRHLFKCILNTRGRYFSSLLKLTSKYQYITSSTYHSRPSRNLYCTSNSRNFTSGQQENFTDSLQKFDNLDLECSGCGTSLHCTAPNTQGYVPTTKLYNLLEQVRLARTTTQDNSSSIDPLICQRCFYLKHYNTALNITLPPQEYKTHLVHLKDKRSLILCIVDVIDYPSSIFPSLQEILGKNSTIYLIGNKIDLLPDMSSKTRTKLTQYLVDQARESLGDLQISRVELVSARTKEGLEKLSHCITKDWGNRGDVYLLGCTNVGKSSLFNHLLMSLCGARPGQAKTSNRIPAPTPTVSHWPGTTLGLLRFPLMSIGKRNRLMEKAKRQGRELEDVIFNDSHDKNIGDDFSEVLPSDTTPTLRCGETKQPSSLISRQLIDITEVLEEIGYKRKRGEEKEEGKQEEYPPQNRHWLNDTPGAVNDTQIVNYLTTKELNLFLPKKRLTPHTVILKKGQTLFIGGLARIDYTEGPVSVYFTVFSPSYLPLHTTKTDRAQQVYDRNLGQPLLKIPTGDSERLAHFPPLSPTPLTITGSGWDRACSDVILSSAGWVGVTAGEGDNVKILAYTLNGKGLYVRSPSLFPDAVNERGKRLQKGNKTMFKGRKNK